MEYIAAPWREPYIRSTSKKETGCVFCRAARTRDDASAFVLDRVHDLIP